MANEYILIKSNNNENGRIALNKTVFASIVSISMDDIDNVSKIPTTTFVNPVKIKINKNKLNVFADIKVKYGANVNATCELLQNKIYENILMMTNIKCNDIGVNVVGFSI